MLWLRPHVQRPNIFSLKEETLTGFGEGYVCPEINQRRERYDALCDDDFLDAGSESSIQYTRGPNNGRLEKALDQLVGRK